MDAPENSAEVIWKFPLHLSGWGLAPAVRHDVKMPTVSVVLALQVQHDVPTLWAMVDPKTSVVTKTFEWVGTGQEVPYGGKYVGTIQLHGGEFVFHLYEVGAG